MCAGGRSNRNELKIDEYLIIIYFRRRSVCCPTRRVAEPEAAVQVLKPSHQIHKVGHSKKGNS